MEIALNIHLYEDHCFCKNSPSKINLSKNYYLKARLKQNNAGKNLFTLDF